MVEQVDESVTSLIKSPTHQAMEPEIRRRWKALEFEYAKRLRECSVQERKSLYTEAYSAVSELAVERFKSDRPEDRTAGTSKKTVALISKFVDKNDRVLEVGSGRGYTCFMLSPQVKSVVGIEVSSSGIKESRDISAQMGLKNVEFKQISATDIAENFGPDSFNICTCIDVLEHLHPEDAKEHLYQAFSILKPGGRYFIQMPNRLTGPHDITKTEFPDAKEALGFHLNESTYKDVVHLMKAIGFTKFRIVIWLKTIPWSPKRPIKLFYQIGTTAEFIFRLLPTSLHFSLLEEALAIRLVAYKPTSPQR